MPNITAIHFADTDTFSLRQLDELNGFCKGTSFRAFKACEARLVEGVDYFLLAASEHEAFIEALKAAGQVYASTVNLLLITRHGYQRMQGG